MKLIFCTKCEDIVKLRNRDTLCTCTLSYGRYIDNLNAVYGGFAIPLGIANNTFIAALKEQPTVGVGKNFTAFVIPKSCLTFRNEKKLA